MTSERLYNPEKASKAIVAICKEFSSATERYGPFSSAHEGYAIILEELDELKAEVWKSPKKRDPEAMRKEAVQVAAMAMRFLHDIC